MRTSSSSSVMTREKGSQQMMVAEGPSASVRQVQTAPSEKSQPCALLATRLLDFFFPTPA